MPFRVSFGAGCHIPMTKLRFLLSVTNEDNDFQIEQVKAARQVASKADVELEVLSARDDGILQSQQLLHRIQSAPVSRPNAVLFEPAGSTVLPQVANAAAAAGIGWALLSRDAEYLNELRSVYHVPAFVVSPDHLEIGRIQGRQLAALLPAGGLVLYIEGPSQSLSATHSCAFSKPTGRNQVHTRPFLPGSSFRPRAQRISKRCAPRTIPWLSAPARLSSSVLRNCARLG